MNILLLLLCSVCAVFGAIDEIVPHESGLFTSASGTVSTNVGHAPGSVDRNPASLWNLSNWSITSTWTYELAATKTITSYRLQGYQSTAYGQDPIEHNYGFPTAWTLLASNDGDAWFPIDVRDASNCIAGEDDFRVANPGSWVFYRISIPATSRPAGTTLGFEEVYLRSGDEPWDRKLKRRWLYPYKEELPSGNG